MLSFREDFQLKSMPNRSISNLNPCCMVRSSISFSNMKKILVSLNHPAHYHLFKNTVAILRQRGYEPLYVISNKDERRVCYLFSGVLALIYLERIIYSFVLSVSTGLRL